MGTCEIQRGEDWRNPAVSRAASCFPASGCSAPLHTCGEQTCHAQSAGSCNDPDPARPHAPACATSQDPRSRVSQCSHNHPFNSPHDHIRTTNPATVRADVRTPFTCATRGCHKMWIENRVIHIMGITVWITHVIIHKLGIILWIAWGQSAGRTRSTCINPVKVLCATIRAERTPTPPALRPVICKCPSPSRSPYDGNNFRNY